MGRKSTVNLPEEEVVEKYKNGESMVKLASFYEVKTHHIDWILRKHGVEKRKNQINSRRYSFNENFFEKIDTEEKSYWLGFMAADGFVQTRGNTFGISLSSVDKSHLENSTSHWRVIIQYMTIYLTLLIRRIRLTQGFYLPPKRQKVI